MAKTSKSKNNAANDPILAILRDKVLIIALLLASAGYIVMQSLAGSAMLAAAFMLGAVWAFRTAETHPNPGVRVMGVLLLLTLGTFMTMYIAVNQGTL